MVKRLLLILVALLLLTNSFAQTDIYPFSQPQQADRFWQLLRELRCLVCQNQDLAHSDAKLAVDLRQLVYKRMQHGQSDEAIRSFLVSRYGQFILFKPELSANTLLRWAAPVVFLLLLLIAFQSRLAKNKEYK